jgi:hypothetical protein
MINSRELAEYLRKRMETQEEVNTVFHLIKVPTVSELTFWITQFKTKDFPTDKFTLRKVKK